MKKLRFQPTFASLTEAELEQLAEAVQRETYDAVPERICKPRSAGGLDLHFTSNNPLVRLHDKKNRLDLINARLCAECADRKKLTLAELNTFISLEKRAPEEVHDAIMSATYDLVTERDNTPHQLLALQRLADFPARAEIRATKEQRAQAQADRAHAKAQRDAEMHTHKTTLDLRKFEHKLDMDTFHQHIATERLDLQKKSLALREKQHQDRLASRSVNNSDDFDPNPVHPSHPGNPVQNPDGSPVYHEDNSDRPKIRILVDEDGEAFTRFPTPNPLPDHIVIKNRAYTKKLLAGLVDPITGEELEQPNDHIAQTGSLPAITPTDATPADPNASLSQQGRGLGEGFSHIPTTTATADLTSIKENTSAPSASDFNSLSAPETQNSELTIQNSASLAEAVDTYTISRVREHIAHNQKYTPWPHRHSPPEYITQFRHCPCGNACPCPTHENEANGGPFPEFFWKLSPFSTDYAAGLREHNLPYRFPKEYLP